MPSETRLTLRLDGAVLERLRTHSAVRLLRRQRTVNRPLRIVYFDTADRRLHRQGFSLALLPGRSGPQAVLRQGDGSSWEDRVWQWHNPDDTKPHAPPADLITPFSKAGLPAGLQPVFVEDIHRATCLIGDTAWEGELVIDRGRLTAHSRETAIADASIVVKRGNSAPAFHLAEHLALSLPVRVRGFEHRRAR